MKIGNSLLIVFVFLYAFLAQSHSVFAAGDDLLSVDKTIVIQFFIFLIALYLLNSLFFKPMLDLADKREELTKGTVGEARDLTEKAEEVINEYNAKIELARDEAFEKRAEIRKEGQVESEKLVSEARNHSQNSLESYQNDLESHISKIKENVKPEIDSLAKEIASKILGKEVS